eukprot:14416791-Alexandrium_andersonii.AAC.1
MASLEPAAIAMIWVVPTLSLRLAMRVTTKKRPIRIFQAAGPSAVATARSSQYPKSQDSGGSEAEIHRRMGSKAMTKRVIDIGQPCLTPVCMTSPG